MSFFLEWQEHPPSLTPYAFQSSKNRVIEEGNSQFPRRIAYVASTGRRSSMLLNSVCGRFANPTCIQRHRNRPSANASNSFCPNSCLCGRSRGPRAQQPGRAQRSSARYCPQNQRGHTQSQRFRDASGTRQPLWHLDGSRSQSVPAVSRSADLPIFFGLTLNSIQLKRLFR